MSGLTAFHLRSPYMGTCGLSQKRTKRQGIGDGQEGGAILFDTFKDSEWVRAAQNDLAVIGYFYADFSPTMNLKFLKHLYSPKCAKIMA